MALSILCRSSQDLCQQSGKGTGIIWRIGTPRKMHKSKSGFKAKNSWRCRARSRTQNMKIAKETVYSIIVIALVTCFPFWYFNLFVIKPPHPQQFRIRFGRITKLVLDPPHSLFKCYIFLFSKLPLSIKATWSSSIPSDCSRRPPLKYVFSDWIYPPFFSFASKI